MYHPGLREPIFPLVLKDTPPVLSVGKRVMHQGYGFHWDPYSTEPYFVTPDGKHLYLTVEDDVPYLAADARCVPAAPDVDEEAATDPISPAGDAGAPSGDSAETPASGGEETDAATGSSGAGASASGPFDTQHLMTHLPLSLIHI